MGTKMIVVAEYTHGVAISEREATPADIAAAHPKCGTCEHKHPEYGYCTNRNSRCWYEEVNPLTDYCPHHSELAPKAPPAAETDEDGYDDWGESDFDVDPDLGAK